ncbi:hypothetical protein [Nitrosomonas communis]|uniref:hypothetical protein n=1 Tax=Nitrosomonas communis TaxID=44574 RepID=UPI0011604525|nr:hypothetical protein [Nitrosomonas communis]
MPGLHVVSTCHYDVNIACEHFLVPARGIDADRPLEAHEVRVEAAGRELHNIGGAGVERLRPSPGRGFQPHVPVVALRRDGQEFG